MSNSTFSGPVRSQNGFQTISVDSTTGAVTTTSTLGTATSVTTLAATTATVTNLVYTDITHPTSAAINATATATAAQVATGYITSTSAATTTITLPTGTLLGAAIGAVQGTILDLYIDNTAGASTITIAVAVNGILSALATSAADSFNVLTVPAGVTGLAKFTLIFSSATAYAFSRTA